MTQAAPNNITLDWKAFIIAYGFRASVHDLVAILNKSEEEIQRVRDTGACVRLPQKKTFYELFSLWHGRAPENQDWPPPRKFHKNSNYQWLTPEVVLLASLAGTLSNDQIAKVLTNRLKKITGDTRARRTKAGIQVELNRIGLQSGDVLGGISPVEAGKEIGSISRIYEAIRKNQLVTRRVGNRLVIPYAAFEAWKAKRDAPPDNFVALSSIREVLSIKSDKLSEFARMGYVPTATRYNQFGASSPTSVNGTWFIDKRVAKKLVADRRAGRAMPWHGKPLLDNLRVTYKLWQERKHPTCCQLCADIWGEAGAPTTFNAYIERYPTLDHGAKRHLTRKWDPGMTVSQVAQYTKRKVTEVRLAIRNGALSSTQIRGRYYVTKTMAVQWKTRKCPSGNNGNSWLAIETACKRYYFSRQELKRLIDTDQLPTKVGNHGATKGIHYVSKQQCVTLRNQLGFTEVQAAKKAGISISRLRTLLAGMNWRQKNKKIPYPTFQAIMSRLTSHVGYTIEEAAQILNKPVAWVNARILDGTVKIHRAKWDRRRRYLSERMLIRLQSIKRQKPIKKKKLSANWLLLSEAAIVAGVSVSTLGKWAANQELNARYIHGKRRYRLSSVRQRARQYWKTARFKRDRRPTWLKQEDPSL